MTWLARCWSAVVRGIGFDDGKGNMSFNKMVTFTALWFFGATVYLTLRYMQMMPPWYVWTFGTLCVYAGFGFKGLALFRPPTTNINQNDNTNTTIDAAALAKAVLARRDADTGTEDTP